MKQRKHFKLAFDADNDAFKTPPEANIEIVRILCDVAKLVHQGAHAGTVHDVNGKTIGQWEWRD